MHGCDAFRDCWRNFAVSNNVGGVKAESSENFGDDWATSAGSGCFDDISSVDSHSPQDMMLYALSEADADVESLRRYDFINWYVGEPPSRFGRERTWTSLHS